MGRRKRLGSVDPPSLVTSARSSFASSPLPRLDPRWLGSTLDVLLKLRDRLPSMGGQYGRCRCFQEIPT